MAVATITKRTVDATKPCAHDIFVWDTDLAGFGLKVTPVGTKVYVFQYRIARPGAADRTPAKRYTIGRHGKLTPDQARKRARELAALVAQGVDPRQRDLDEIAAVDAAARHAAEKARLEGELVFEKMAAIWLDRYENEKDRRPKSVRLAKLVVNKHLLPQLRSKSVPHIGRADLQPILDVIPAQQRGMRRAVFAYASVLFGWLVKRGDISENPLTQMEKPQAPPSRDRVLSDSEVWEVWRSTWDLNGPFGPFFRLLILTGQRRDEIAAMEWSELDQHTETWSIPASRAKNKLVHLVPLSPAVVLELDRLATATSTGAPGDERVEWPKSGFVLTTTHRTPISGISKAKAALDRTIAAYNAGTALPNWRIHDLRRTVATGFQKLGVRYEVTEAVLNHVSGAKSGIAGIYQRHDWKEEKRSALEVWARHLSTLWPDNAGAAVVSIGTNPQKIVGR